MGGRDQFHRQSTLNKYGEVLPDDEFNEIENDPTQISFGKWLSQYGLDHFYQTFVQLGFDNVYVKSTFSSFDCNYLYYIISFILAL